LIGIRLIKAPLLSIAKAANTAKKSVFEASPFSNVTPLYPETPPAEPNISSTQTQLQPQKVIGTEFLWSGSQLIEEAPIYADGSIGYQQATHWYYKDSEFTPSVQVSHNNGTRRLHHVISDHLGTPREMMDEQGDIVWRRKHSTWGSTKLWPMAQTAAANDALHCPFVFPGQYEDQESGLHYNRHRYYNPHTAQYLSPDPLGLEGGFTPQSYVHNPNGWIDPLGLAGCDVTKSGTFPKTADEMSSVIGQPKKAGTTPDGTVRTTWMPNYSTKIRHQSHPHGLKPGDAGYNPRHHGEHFHVETKSHNMSWSQTKKQGQILKSKPEGYTPGSGTGFLSDEKVPGL